MKINVGMVMSGMVVSLLSAGAYAALYNGGDGTPGDPYQIGTVAGWTTLADESGDWDKQFILMNDLDFDGVEVKPIGTSSLPFTGLFNGDGHATHNVLINVPVSNYVGLFGCVGAGGEIRGLGVEAVSVTGNGFVGGLAGSVDGGTVTLCYATGAIVGDWFAGGLVGENKSGTVASCYAACAVSGDGDIGGLVGRIDNGTCTFCYAAGTVTGNVDVGGFAGYNYNGTVSSCYWDIGLSGQLTSAGGEERTTAEMTYPYAAGTYEGWNFATVWAEDVDGNLNGGYPYLRDNVPSLPHPADRNKDFRVVMGEAIGYLTGWQQGGNPMAYAIRAAYLWQNGERYLHDDGTVPPTCWVLSP
ncbi:MAG: hypothetical protein BWY09_01478 [Candidatus Hydrogenedentes bacterium ADurb.Bin179]|nr:MAG: hypothetical protein BWY09_01478 [Candidatus Hydrogenedentes bacterium ADurb.Bin179]